MRASQIGTARQADATLLFGRALLPGGWAEDVRIDVTDGRIAEVTTGVPVGSAAQSRIALPGVANLHSHSFQRGMAGLAEHRSGPGRDSFWSWREVMYRFAHRATPEDIEAIAAMAFMEMAMAGYTRVAEFHYLHHQPDGTPYDDPAELAARIVVAAGLAGIGLTLLPVFYAHSGFGGAEPTEAQRRFANTLDSYAVLIEGAKRHCADLHGGVLGVAPHSLRAVTPGELAEVASLRPKLPVHIHIAEQEKEVEDCLAWSGARPVEWLLDNADVDARWCLVHATHTTPEELRRMAGTGAVAGLCPVTEANLGDGIFDMPGYRAHHGRFGVGTDSNIAISLNEELRMLEYSQRLRFRERNVVADPVYSSGRVLFEEALAGGHQACGVSGGLSAGQPADLVCLRTSADPGRVLPGDRTLDGWVFRNTEMAVETVWSDGVPVVDYGVHVRQFDIMRRYAQAMKRLLA